ncbi:conserved hypothetical protein [Ricinus communis]|uniref:Uncharacterized protein n=1 Tax=Ricinus communis TaxID=3988 RepID=B9RL58_RICCO|nr:conserved hypothetical protein [Ricinus communis]
MALMIVQLLQIFLGLHELLGKQIPVGLHNLTWTLLKSIQFNDQYEASDIETLSENYSMLNIALDMMHECFDPVEEPHTKRDLDLLKDMVGSENVILDSPESMERRWHKYHLLALDFSTVDLECVAY